MIFQVLTAVSVNRAVVLVVTPRGLIEIPRPFFFEMKLEVIGSFIFMVETELVPSSKSL